MKNSEARRLLEADDKPEEFKRQVIKHGNHVYKIEPYNHYSSLHADKPTLLYSVIHSQAGSNHGWEIGKFKTLEGAHAVAALHAQHAHAHGIDP